LRQAFTEFPDRFLLGTDTFTPERWYFVVEHAQWSRQWLADLPPAVAERIAWKNGERLFGLPQGQRPA
jgi:predicted TIM-barrel fold metal-dependent hydrolase